MYTDFAYLYDELINDVNYTRWADYIEKLINKHGTIKCNDLILDLGCGTGNVIVEMAKKGYEMIGVDLSSDMLHIAREKLEDAGQKALLLNQDMAEFELYGTVSAIISTLDSLNYVTKISELKKVFALVHNYLDNNGIFVFDINTEYKFEKVLGDNTFHYVSDDVTYIWQCNYDKRKKQCEYDLTFFVFNEEIDAYKRFDESHIERMYKHEDVIKCLSEAGLKFVAVYDELSERKATAKSQRVFYVCKKV